MKTIGLILLFVGVLVGMYAFSVDTSVPTIDSTLGISRVNNLGLMSEKQNMLFIAGIICVIGSIFIGAGYIAESVRSNQRPV